VDPSQVTAIGMNYTNGGSLFGNNLDQN